VKPEEPVAFGRLGRLFGGCENTDDGAVVIGFLPDRCLGMLERDPELPDHMGHDREHKAWDVGREQRVECPPDAIVAEPTEVFSSRARSFLHPFRTRRLVYEAVLRK